jgi:hypothetical protein
VAWLPCQAAGSRVSTSSYERHTCTWADRAAAEPGSTPHFPATQQQLSPGWQRPRHQTASPSAVVKGLAILLMASAPAAPRGSQGDRLDSGGGGGDSGGDGGGDDDDGNGFDSRDFCAVDWINAHFPTEHSLSTAEECANQLCSREQRLEAKMHDAIAAQAASVPACDAALCDARAVISGVFEQVHQIQDKAAQAQDMVGQITADIRALNHAKGNLTTTVTALRRLQMLVQALDKLRTTASQRQYRAAAGLLVRVDSLPSGSFAELRDRAWWWPSVR